MELKQKNTEAALKVIAAKDNIPDWMSTPFTIGQDTYATDGHSIIKVPKNSVGAFGRCMELNIEEKVLGFFDFKHSKILDIKVSELRDAISEIPIIDEYINVDSEIKCTECNGNGEVNWEYDGYFTKMDCPVCDGEGNINKSKKEKTGKKIMEGNYCIGINKSIIRVCMIAQLITIAESLKVEVIEVIKQPNKNKAIILKVGIAEILMMPVWKGNLQDVVQYF